MDSTDSNSGPAWSQATNTNLIPDDPTTQLKIGLLAVFCVMDNNSLQESLVQRFGVSLPVAEEYIDTHLDAIPRAREFLENFLNAPLPQGNGTSASIHNPANNGMQNTPPAPAPAPAQPPPDEDEHLTEDGSNDDESHSHDDEIVTDTELNPPQPPVTKPVTSSPEQPKAPTAPADKGKQVQRIPSPDPTLSPRALTPPPMATTYADRVKANPNHGQQKKKKDNSSSQQRDNKAAGDKQTSPTAPPPPINHDTRPTDKSTRTPAGRRPTFKETVHALKKRHPKGHPRILYFRFVNPNDATNALSGQANAALLDKFRTKCDIPVRYVSANPEFTKYTVLPEENTNNEQQAKIQHALATVIGCHAHQLALSFYKYRVSLLFTNVKCVADNIDGTTRLISAADTLTNAVRRSSVDAWRDAYQLQDPRPNAVRWGPRAQGATTATLFVDINDDYNYTTTKHVHDKVLQFDCGPRITHVAHVRPETIQCANCQKFGHPTIRCRSRPACGICGNPHPTTDHVFITVHNPSFNEIRCRNCSGPHHATDPSCPNRPKRPIRSNPAAQAWAQTLQEDPRNAPYNQPTDLQQMIEEAVRKALSQVSNSSTSTSASAGRRRK